MKSGKTTFLIVLLIGVSASITVLSQQSDDNNGTVFLGRSYSFVLKEPNGWIMNSEIAKSQGLEAVLYRKGSSWKNAIAVMYARVIYKDGTQDTVEKVISNDVIDFMKLSKESKVADSPPIKTRYKEGIAKEFYDAANKNYEVVTFIDEPKVVVILALSSRDKSEYEKALPDFKSLVGSYFVFTPLVDPK